MIFNLYFIRIEPVFLCIQAANLNHPE